jgi:hypothetical protein
MGLVGLVGLVGFRFGHPSRTFGARAFGRRRLGVWAKAGSGAKQAEIVARSRKPRILRVAREKLGPQATLEELALECHIQRITPRIRKILRRIERAA